MCARPSSHRSLDSYALSFDARHLREHTFLLGDRGGFVLYLPAARNPGDRGLQGIKWFGASGFGRSFLEGLRVWVEAGAAQIELNRENQTDFVMRLDGATRIYRVNGRDVRESFFVPDGYQTVVWTLQTDLPCAVKPEFDMRYYQAFSSDFSRYSVEETDRGLFVCNQVENVGPLHAEMRFYGLVGTIEGAARVEMLPPDQRLVTKTYLRDERREKLVVGAYKETMERDPDEAPIWDVYSTKVYAPAIFRSDGSMSLACAFGDDPTEVRDGLSAVHRNLPTMRRQKDADALRQLQEGLLETGNRDVDLAYAHILTRFNDALVARDATLHIDPVHQQHYYAIFAGDKYFMDAWKRDENVSLEALLATNDYQTVRKILGDTWQFQDDRTGRLPHIIRAGEPLVYYSSDGTLWALQRLYEYTRDSGDQTLLEAKMPMVEKFYSASRGFVRQGLLPSGGIIDKSYLWETWEDTPYTPRAGYPVEIELLWLTTLAELLPAVRRHNGELAAWMAQTLEEGKQTFSRFVCDGSYLADSLTYAWQRECLLTPNGYIAFGLDFPLPPALAYAMVLLGRQQLAGERGIRSLAPRDWPCVLPKQFLEDPHNVRGTEMASVGIFNYHRGIEWEWLNPFFVAGELTYGSTEQAFRLYVEGQVREAIGEVGIGGLSELHDRHGQVGADFQAWSMAGFLRGLHLFAGIKVDAPAKTVRIRPSIPTVWPYLRCRRRVGDTRFDVHYEERSGGTRRLEVHLLDQVPDGYTLELGLRVPDGARVASTGVNGGPMKPQAWDYRPSGLPDVEGEIWTSRPLDGNLTLEVKLE